MPDGTIGVCQRDNRTCSMMNTSPNCAQGKLKWISAFYGSRKRHVKSEICKQVYVLQKANLISFSNLENYCEEGSACPVGEFCNFDDFDTSRTGSCESCQQLVPGVTCKDLGLVHDKGVETCEEKCKSKQKEYSLFEI